MWGTTSTVVRQRAVPDAVLGRVGGVYRVAIRGGMVIGTPIGGLLARSFGITAPFWFGFFGSALLVALLWREFDHIVHAGDAPGDSGGPAVAAGRGRRVTTDKSMRGALQYVPARASEACSHGWNV